ncbi:MAG: hypothetical protein V1824_03955 [archaeon]
MVKKFQKKSQYEVIKEQLSKLKPKKPVVEKKQEVKIKQVEKKPSEVLEMYKKLVRDPLRREPIKKAIVDPASKNMRKNIIAVLDHKIEALKTEYSENPKLGKKVIENFHGNPMVNFESRIKAIENGWTDRLIGLKYSMPGKLITEKIGRSLLKAEEQLKLVAESECLLEINTARENFALTKARKMFNFEGKEIDVSSINPEKINLYKENFNTVLETIEGETSRDLSLLKFKIEKPEVIKKRPKEKPIKKKK